jgi:hypothetical protein
MPYHGARKRKEFLEGSYHHIIEFDVDVSEPNDHAWTLVRHPMVWPATASLWPGYYDGCKWVGYNWVDQMPSWVDSAEFVIELRR